MVRNKKKKKRKEEKEKKKGKKKTLTPDPYQKPLLMFPKECPSPHPLPPTTTTTTTTTTTFEFHPTYPPSSSITTILLPPSCTNPLPFILDRTLVYKGNAEKKQKHRKWNVYIGKKKIDRNQCLQQ
ncbi:hypothetical protein P167DRAFT_50235 [Morchella conica CCBAS932]|uniref:Uncharacterized protein n=1 Tax=Morchella conica CCBAS932 TaxID=1392247 RepID=A0A3N4KLR8_9PEZI|nr:hypothetical protein P167DRAFT_50235 [Morchella conica CCBAS932]